MLGRCGATAVILASPLFTLCVTHSSTPLASVVSWSWLGIKFLSFPLCPIAVTLFASTLWYVVFSSLGRCCVPLLLLLLTTVALLLNALFVVAGGWILWAVRRSSLFGVAGGRTPFRITTGTVCLSVASLVAFSSPCDPVRGFQFGHKVTVA